MTHGFPCDLVPQPSPLRVWEEETEWDGKEKGGPGEQRGRKRDSAWPSPWPTGPRDPGVPCSPRWAGRGARLDGEGQGRCGLLAGCLTGTVDEQPSSNLRRCHEGPRAAQSGLGSGGWGLLGRAGTSAPGSRGSWAAGRERLSRREAVAAGQVGGGLQTGGCDLPGALPPPFAGRFLPEGAVASLEVARAACGQGDPPHTPLPAAAPPR